MLFANSPYVALDVLCFLLSVFCGLVITQHFEKKGRRWLGVMVSAAVGLGVGLFLENGLSVKIVSQDFRPYFRPTIGLVGSMLGAALSAYGVRITMSIESPIKSSLTPFKALFWKEYRQHNMLAIGVAAICVLVLSIVYCVGGIAYPINPYYAIAMFFVALYAGSLASVLFSNEHDEKTFMVLRNQPLSNGAVARAKLAWLFVSTTAVFAAIMLAALGFAAFCGDNSTPKEVFGVCGIGVIEGICWGLFWTTRLKSQLNSLLCTFISSSIGLQFCTSMYVAYNHAAGSVVIPDGYADAVWFRLALVIPVGAFGVYNAFGWLRRRELESAETISTKTKNRGRGVLACSRFLSLCAITVRQSRILLFCCVSIFASISVYVFIHSIYYIGIGNIDASPSYPVNTYGIITLMVYCGSVFFADQKANGTKLLIYNGVSPVEIWYSRIFVFGVPLLAFLAITVLPLSVSVIKEHHFIWYLPDSWAVGSWMNNYAVSSLFLLIYFTCYVIATFSIGQLASLSLRSGILGIVFTMIGSALLFYWWGNTLYIFGLSPVWTTVPFIFLFFIAGRLRAADWMRGRTALKDWMKPTLVILIPFLCILIAIPIVRVYSVPKIDYGYRLDPQEIDKPLYSTDIHFNSDASMEYQDLRDAIRNSVRGQIINKYLSGANTDEKRKVAWEKIKSDTDAKVDYRESQLNNIRKVYEYDYRMIKSGVVLFGMDGNGGGYALKLFRYFPWEKTRTLRLLNNEFQTVSRAFEKIEKVVSTPSDDPNVPFGGDIYEPHRELIRYYRRIESSTNSMMDQTAQCFYYHRFNPEAVFLPAKKPSKPSIP